ncbi:MAG: CapA family protein [Anaerovoracaceae bacterium]
MIKKLTSRFILFVVVFNMAFATVVFASDNTDTENAKIYLTGDIMCQYKQQSAASTGTSFDFTPTFKYVKNIFKEGDLVIGNLETLISKDHPLSTEVKRVEGKPYLNSPFEFLEAIKDAGYTALVNANNHNCDGGIIGLENTIKAIKEVGLETTGTFDRDQEKRYISYDVKGIKVGVLSYAAYFNAKEHHLGLFERNFYLNRFANERIKNDVKQMREDGIEYIIAYSHWGSEYTNTENPLQRKCAKEMAEAGVDYIIGSHPHALQRYDIIKTTDGRKVPIVYSMGNFTSNMGWDISKDTIILSIELSKKNGKVILENEGYYPCYMMTKYGKDNYVVMPISKKYNDNYSSKELNKAKKRIVGVMGNKIPVFQ